LIAFAALLMACFRQSKRRAAQFLGLILNQPACAGWMVVLQNRAAEAVRPAYDELARHLPREPVLLLDESPTKQGPAKAWVWTFVAAVHLFRLPHQSGGRSAQTPPRPGLCRGHQLRPGADVLVLRPPAVVLGTLET